MDIFQTTGTIIWYTLLALVIVFLIMGVLVVFGLKKEVKRMLDIGLEGSFTILDFFQFLRELIVLIKNRIGEALILISPVIAYILALAVYLIFLFIYKYVGSKFDVTLLTILLTMVLVGTVGLFNSPGSGIVKPGWSSRFGAKIKQSFGDALEVVIFVFFLTMDSTKLFFIPESLNVQLSAEVGSYDLMVRGFHLNKTTLNLIIAAVVSEIVRNIIRIVALSKSNYQLIAGSLGSDTRQKYDAIKKSIRAAFEEAKDDLVKFITFTTVLLFVFLMFPRLKLLSMLVASLTSLALDLALPARLSETKGEDLISKILAKLFKI
jgi:hypothetical protein